MKTMLKFNPCHRVCPLYKGWEGPLWEVEVLVIA